MSSELARIPTTGPANLFGIQGVALATRGVQTTAATAQLATRAPGTRLNVALEVGQAARPISTGQLRRLLGFHTRPINVVVFDGSLGALRPGTPSLEAGFPLRCFQRLSVPYMATRLCFWRNNRSTRGTSTQVLSYYGQLLSSVLRPRQIGTKLSHDVLNPARVPL